MKDKRTNLKVLENDSNQGNSGLDETTLRIIDLPEHAVTTDFEVHKDHVHYRPESGYLGPDSFTYEICNDDGLCDTATVNLNVSDGASVCPALSGCPLAEDDSYTFAMNQRRNLRVLQNDSNQGNSELDESTLTITDLPDHAVADRFEVSRGRVIYRAKAGYVGPDSFTYEICNAAGLCDEATVEILVTPSAPFPDVCSGYTESTILFSYDIDRRDAEPLNNIVFLGQNTYITMFATVPETTERVAFYVDDRDRTGQPFTVEFFCAYDLIGTGPNGLPRRSITIGDFGIGFHSITIEVFDQDGSSEVHTADFGVLVGGDPGPPPEHTTGTDCARARAGDTNLSDSDLTNCPLNGLDLSNADLVGADLTLSNLVDANLQGAQLVGAALIGANLTSAELQEADFQNAKLAGANLTGVFANKADFAGAQLHDAKLVGADLTNTDLDDADLRRSDLTDADLTESDLVGAKLQDAIMIRSTLTAASLVDAMLQRVDLTDSGLSDTDLPGANLAHAVLAGATGVPNGFDDATFVSTTCPDGSIATAFSCWSD